MIKYASLLFFMLLFSSCVSDRAFIEKTDGTVVEARITDGNYKTLYASKDNSELIQIDRAEIADIDHPGNVAIVFGSLLTVAGVGALYGGSDTEGAANAATILFGGILSVWGLTSLGKGLYVWMGSTGRAAGSGQPANFSLKNSGAGFKVSL